MENEQLEDEEPYYQHDWRNENVLTDVDVVDSMDETCGDDTKPKSLDTLHLCISFPPEGFLTDWEAPSVVEESEEGKSPSSIERHTHHTKEYVREVSKYRSKHRIVDDGFVTLSCVIEIDHVFDIFCKSKTQGDDSDTIHIVGDALCLYPRSQEEPQDDESYEAETANSHDEDLRICIEESMDKCTDDEYVEENNRHPERFPDTEDEECQLCEFFEKREEEYDTILGPTFGYTECFERATKIADKIISFYIEFKKEQRQLFSTHVWILDRPVKGQENTGDNDYTSEEERETLSDTDLPIPHDKTRVEESSNAGNHEREPKCLKKIENEWEIHNYWTT